MSRFLEKTSGILVLFFIGFTNVHAEEPSVASSDSTYSYCDWLKKVIERSTNPNRQRREQVYKALCGFPRPEFTNDNPCRFSCRDSNGKITHHTESRTLYGGNYCEYLCETRCPRLGLTCAQFQIRQPMGSGDVDTTCDAPYLDEGDVYDEDTGFVTKAPRSAHQS